MQSGLCKFVARAERPAAVLCVVVNVMSECPTQPEYVKLYNSYGALGVGPAPSAADIIPSLGDIKPTSVRCAQYHSILREKVASERRCKVMLH